METRFGAAGGDEAAGPVAEPLILAMEGGAGRREAVWREVGERAVVECGVHDVAAAIERDGEAQARARVDMGDAHAGAAVRFCCSKIEITK